MLLLRKPPKTFNLYSFIFNLILMINVAHKDGFIIDHKLFYGYQEPNKKYINLAQTL